MESETTSKVSWFNPEEFSVLDLAQWLEENHQSIKGFSGAMVLKDGTVISTAAGVMSNAEVCYVGNILIERALDARFA